jgi:hypothetical protein
MSAPIVSKRGSTSGRRGIAGHPGKGPVIGGAIVVLLVAALLGGHALTERGSASHDANATNPSALSASVRTAQYYDDLMSQQQDWIQTMAARATMRQAATYYDDLMAQQDDFLHTMAARADALQVNPSPQQRFLEENTITLPSAGASATRVKGCNDEMICLSMYAPISAPANGSAVTP